MSDASYRRMYRICYPMLWVSARPVVLHAHRAARAGGYILAANHLSPFDVPVIFGHTPRQVDFLSVVEMKRNPFVRWVYGQMNTFYMDRSRNDPTGAKQALDRLKNGRVVAMFPEAQIRSEADSVLNGGSIKPGVAHLAQVAGVPVVPCAIWNTQEYWKPKSWLPIRKMRYGIIYGNPIEVRTDVHKTEARRLMLEELRDAFAKLGTELRAAMK
jgi:1-acyl-sn-glycerol-3-phosphate acyltransferase